MRTSWSLAILLLAFATTSIAAKSWWETASFYQIYPRSYKDSNGDGVGDLNGVTSTLPYLKEIGITGTWLSPFLKSPMADFGYDISDFKAVDPLFGTMADFENMVRQAKALGIRIILDFVPNHSSDECEWFKKSAARDPVYKDYYVWHPGKIDWNGARQPPTNWVSVFRGSAWTWHEGRQEYYLHQFDKKQPDLNYRNPQVQEEMKEVLRFWLRKGVDGFRVDAIHHGYEAAPDAYGNYPDEPVNQWNNDPEDYGYTNHIHTTDQPETPLLVFEWRRVLQQFQRENGGDERILMVETWSPIDETIKYYGNANNDGAQIPFNFQMISYLQPNSDAYHYVDLINAWLYRMPAGKVANWVIGSHDKNRVGSRYGENRIDMFNIMLLTLPGCSITYQGEEIGMLDVWISWKNTVDPQACNSYEEGFEYRSRDPARTPFQWNSSPNAGFSTAQTTWLPVSDNYRQLNMESQRNVALSHLNIFKQLQQVRKETTMQNGAGEVKAVNRYVLGIKRSLSGDYTFITLLNIFDSIENFNLNTIFSGLSGELEFVMANDKSLHQKGDKIPSNFVTLMPYESIVLKTTTRM